MDIVLPRIVTHIASTKDYTLLFDKCNTFLFFSLNYFYLWSNIFRSANNKICFISFTIRSILKHLSYSSNKINVFGNIIIAYYYWTTLINTANISNKLAITNQRRDNMKTLQNKVAIITGGGRGIGFGLAKAFAKAGANLTLLPGETEILYTMLKRN